MFGWLKKKKSSGFSFDVFYPPAEREVYAYWDGEKVVKADPMTIYKKLMSVGPELSVDIKVASSPCKDAKEADDEVVRKIRGIFDIKEQGGLTENGCKELLDNYLEFCETLKKNWNLPSISSTSSDQNTPVTNPITSPSLESGSTVEGASTALPQ